MDWTEAPARLRFPVIFENSFNVLAPAGVADARRANGVESFVVLFSAGKCD